MTTLAYDGVYLACDSQMTCGTMRSSNKSKKIFTLKNGWHVALAGDLALCAAALKWIVDGMDPDNVPKAGDKSLIGLIIKNSNDMIEIDERFMPFEAHAPWVGGTGEKFAMACMVAGLSAKRAVEVSCKLDVNSCEPIQVIQVFQED